MTTVKDRESVRFLLLLVLVNLLWGSTFATNKYLLSGGIGPGSLALVRMFIAGLSVLPFALWFRIPFPQGRDFLDACMLGFLANGLAVPIEYVGTQWTTASNVAVLIATEAAQCMILGAIFYRERITHRKIFGFVFCLGGACVVLWKDLIQTSLLSSETFKGDLLVLLAAFFYALYTIRAKSVTVRCPPQTLFVTVALASCVPLLFWSGGELVESPPWTYSLGTWLGILHLAIPCLSIPMVLWYILLRHVSAGAAGCSIFLQTLFGVFFAAIFLGERPGLPLFFAAGMILVGLYLAVVADRSA